MRYFLMVKQDNVTRQQEITPLQVGKIIQSEIKDKDVVLEKLANLRKFGWVIINNKTIESRTY